MKELIYSLIGSWFGSRNALLQLNTEHKYKDANNNLPILLDILEDLSILEQAFLHNGEFCPLIEHRCPELSAFDGDGINTMSYAQRAHYFRMIGNKLIKNCRKIIYLTQNAHLPTVLNTCREIKDYLLFKKIPDQKSYLDYMIGVLNNSMSSKTKNNAEIKIQNKKTINAFVEKLRAFHDKLDNAIEAELPYLATAEKKYKIQYWLNFLSTTLFLICVLYFLCFLTPTIISMFFINLTA